MESRIIAALTAAFAPSELIVVDDSESHRGHSGFKEGGETHFNVKNSFKCILRHVTSFCTQSCYVKIESRI